MLDPNLIRVAEEMCTYHHKGVFRKGSNEPYSSHPQAVRDILKRYGYEDIWTQCIALLHDIVEDTDVKISEITKKFGYEISNGVYILSLNTINDEYKHLLSISLRIYISKITNEGAYKTRLSGSRDSIKNVKIADNIHNTQDLTSLSPEGIEKKITDAIEFYIPMGRTTAPLMIKKLEENIINYLKS